MAQENSQSLQPVQNANGQLFFEPGKFVGDALDAIVKAADVAEAKVIRNTTLGAGIVLLLLAIAGAFVPNLGHSVSAASVISGGALILAALIVSSWEYKIQLESEDRRLEVEARRFEAETQFRIAQIKATQPTTHETTATIARPR